MVGEGGCCCCCCYWQVAAVAKDYLEFGSRLDGVSSISFLSLILYNLDVSFDFNSKFEWV